METRTAQLLKIASKFLLASPATAVESPGEGFINDTYILHTADADTDYILQRKNRNIFPDVPRMMENIRLVTDHIRRKVIERGGDPMREVLTLIPTRDGELYHKDEEGEYWVVTLFIPRTVTYSQADSEDLARKGGKGIGKFQSELDDFCRPLSETIKGFHNMRHRLMQWDEAIAADRAGRCASLATEIGWINARRDEMLHFWELVETGTLPLRVTHNDTKISNILFDSDTNDVLCTIDLDTVMNSTSLNDFGDAIRSYANTGAEDDPDLERVGLSLGMFRAYTEGYLSQRARQLCPAEIDNLALSARYITFEQVLRFLMDYIDGDRYYKIKYPGHNLVRTHAQYRLLESMEEQYGQMDALVHQIFEKYR